MSTLEGRVIAVAGAAGGLGPTVCRTLADAGATVAASDIDQSKLDDLASELGIADDRWDGRASDLLSADGAAAWADAIAERFGKVDGLVHLVGGWKGGDPLATASLDDYEWLHNLLVRTVQHASRAFHDAIAHEGGRFVLVSSTQARKPDGTNASYGAAKAASEAWTLALADSLSESGATSNIVVVNAILTPAMREENPNESFANFTSVEDIAAAIAYLCSDASKMMNGARLELHP
jgi:NAD(P)-dependent dehydrogenase (short-subunit alcohol dehydrogenase family)